MPHTDLDNAIKKQAETKNLNDASVPVQHLLRFFQSDHLDDAVREPAALCAQVARHMARTLPNNPETVAGLRKLLEAKDCFVRSKLIGDTTCCGTCG